MIIRDLLRGFFPSHVNFDAKKASKIERFDWPKISRDSCPTSSALALYDLAPTPPVHFDKSMSCMLYFLVNPYSPSENTNCG